MENLWRQLAQNRIEKEYQCFFEQMMQASKEQIWEQCGKIRFYCSIREYFRYNEEVPEGHLGVVAGMIHPIAEMWDCFLKQEYLYIDTWEEITELLGVTAVGHQGGVLEDEKRSEE